MRSIFCLEASKTVFSSAERVWDRVGRVWVWDVARRSLRGVVVVIVEEDDMFGRGRWTRE